MYRIEYRDNFLKEKYLSHGDAIKAAIAIAGNADLGDNNVYVIKDDDSSIAYDCFKAGVQYESGEDKVSMIIRNNDIDYVIVNSDEVSDDFTLDDFDRSKLLNAKIDEYPIVRWNIEYKFPGSRFYVGDPDLADFEYPGMTLELIVKPDAFRKNVLDDKEFILEHEKYFSMSAIITDYCNGINISRYKNWKRGKVKELSPSEYRAIRKAMEKAAGK